MHQGYAKGIYALAVCDRCGQWYRYAELMREWLQYRNIQGQLARTNIRVCMDCRDTEVRVKQVHADALALRHPRVDVPEPPVLAPDDPNAFIPDSAGLLWDDQTNTWGPPRPNMDGP